MRNVRAVTVSLLIGAAGACSVLGLVETQSVPGNQAVIAAQADDDDTHWAGPTGDDDTHW